MWPRAFSCQGICRCCWPTQLLNPSQHRHLRRGVWQGWKWVNLLFIAVGAMPVGGVAGCELSGYTPSLLPAHSVRETVPSSWCTLGAECIESVQSGKVLLPTVESSVSLPARQPARLCSPSRRLALTWPFIVASWAHLKFVFRQTQFVTLTACPSRSQERWLPGMLRIQGYAGRRWTGKCLLVFGVLKPLDSLCSAEECGFVVGWI